MANRANRTNTHVEIHDAYQYRKKSTCGEKSYYICAETKSLNCPARGSIDNGSMVLTTPHCHPPLVNKLECEEFKDKLWTELASSEENLRTIYDSVAISHPTAASIVPFCSVERSMKRWRLEMRPPTPQTLLEFHNIVNLEEWKKYREDAQGCMIIESIFIDDETAVTIFGDAEFVASLHNIEELYIDATFSVCPRQMNILQFLTIMGRIDDTPTPLAWALMTKKTETAYRTVFNYFRTRIAPRLQPRIVHQDFEIAMKNAIVNVYPDVTVIHCYFHYCQAIFRRVKKRGPAGLERLRKWDIALVFYRKLLGLALLPAANIEEAFLWLVRNTPPDVLEFFDNVVSYYRNWWINNVTPMRFSVYRLQNRTNNPIEAYHRILHNRFGTQPGIWQFTARLKALQGITRIEVRSLDRGLEERRSTRQEYVNRERVLSYMWDLYDNDTLSTPKFLSCYNHVSPAFDNDIQISTSAEVDRFCTYAAHNIGVQPNDNPVEAITFEGFNNQSHLPILRRNARENNLQIFILENIEDSLCPLCRRSVLNVVSMPCKHWFLCQNCTELQTAEAFARQAALICGICMNQCIGFKTIQIS